MRREDHIAAMNAQKEQYESKIIDLEEKLKCYNEAEMRLRAIDALSDDITINAKEALNKINGARVIIMSSYRDRYFKTSDVLNLLGQIESIIYDSATKNQ